MSGVLSLRFRQALERGRFARAGRARHQQDAVGAPDHLINQQIPLRSENIGEIEQHRGLVERSTSRRARGRGWSGWSRRGTSDAAPTDGRREMRASCGRRFFRDIQAGHDLHAGGERRLEPLRRPHDLVQHAVDAEADPEHLFVGLEVDVGRASANRVDQDHVHEPDDRRLVGRLLQLEDVGLGDDLVVAPEDLDVALGPLELATSCRRRFRRACCRGARWPCECRPGRRPRAGFVDSS